MQNAIPSIDHSPHRVGICLLFTTDVGQDPQQIYRFYQLRFQIEFLCRDAKQLAGLEDRQARDPVKLAFHFSLTALNLAKVETNQNQVPLRSN